MEARFITAGDGISSSRRIKVALSRPSTTMPGYRVDITTLTVEEAKECCKALIRLLMQEEVKK